MEFNEELKHFILKMHILYNKRDLNQNTRNLRRFCTIKNVIKFTSCRKLDQYDNPITQIRSDLHNHYKAQSVTCTSPLILITKLSEYPNRGGDEHLDV